MFAFRLAFLRGVLDRPSPPHPLHPPRQLLLGMAAIRTPPSGKEKDVTEDLGDHRCRKRGNWAHVQVPLRGRGRAPRRHAAMRLLASSNFWKLIQSVLLITRCLEGGGIDV